MFILEVIQINLYSYNVGALNLALQITYLVFDKIMTIIFGTKFY